MTTKISTDNIQAATLASIGSGPKISQIIICDSSYTELDDTAISLNGGYIKIVGSGFKAGATVAVNRSLATSVTFISSTELRAQVPAQAANSYIVYVTNTDGSVAIRVNGLTYSSEPTWVTGGSLTGDSDSAISIQLTATGASVYSLQSGSTLPTGLTLSSSGLISGTVNIENETLYNFTVLATDAELQDSPRAFSITITVGDPFFAATTLLLPGSAETFVRDASTNNFPVTLVGNTLPNTFNPYLTGWSNYFDGTGDFLNPETQAAFAFGTGDFTVECWIYATAASNSAIYEGRADSSTSDGFTITAFSSSVIRIFSGSALISSSGTNYLNQWTHVAVCRLSGTTTLYINGVSVGTTTSLGDNATGSAVIGAGRYAGATTISNSFTGYISNFRLVKGTAVYTANFSPPTAPLTAVAGTSLLTCQSNRFIDNSTNNFAITRTGDVAVQSFSPFVESASSNGSAYFGGTGEYLTAIGNSNLAPGTGDFTIEGWIYGVNLGTWRSLCVVGTSTDNGVYLNTANRVVWYEGGINAESTVIIDKMWNHFAVTRSGTTLRVFLNGVKSANDYTTSTNYSRTTLNIGANGGTTELYTGYLSNFRIVKGTAVYTANFTPPTSPLTAITNTSLLTLQNNTPANNSTFLDLSSNNLLVTRAGNTTQGSFSPYGENWSCYFDGVGDYLSIVSTNALNFGTSDFTVEFWVNFSNAAGSIFFFVDARNASQTNAWVLNRNTSNQLQWFSGQVLQLTSVTTISTTGVWYHVAITRNSGTLRFWINGVDAGGSGADTINYNINATPLIVGSRYNGQDYLSGYISNLRIVKGTAVYTSNFTPSTTPLQPIANTVLLTCRDPNIVDDSLNRFAITRTGDVSVQKFGPFAGTTLPAPYYSAYFDGSGDRITVPASANYLFSGDFTIEGWMSFNNTATASPQVLFSIKSGSTEFDLRWNATRWQMSLNAGSGTDFGTTAPAARAWTHVAAVRSGSSIKLYVNGVATGVTLTNSTALGQNAQVFCIAGSSTASNQFAGYIADVRVINGSALYNANFTPPTAPVSQVSNTVLMLCRGPTFTDSSSNAVTVTAVGDSRPTTHSPYTASYSMRQSYTPAVYGGSMYFDGTGDYLLVPTSTTFGLGTSNFTIELWFYTPTKLNATPVILSTGNFGASKWQLNDRHSGTPTKLTFNLYNASTSNGWLTSTSVITNNTWYHVAIVRNGNAFTMYLNGIAEATATYTGSADGGTTQPIYVAQDGGQAGTNYNGYISDIRITKGQALYTSNFVPQNKPLTAVTNSILLVNGTAAAITDATTENVLETVGDAKISTAVAKFGGSSMYFDGTGDSVTARNTIPIGSGNFTVEFWVYPLSNSNTSFPGMFDCRNAGSDTNGFGLYYNGGSTFVLRIGGDNFASSQTVALNQWSHVALCRVGTTMTCYINGISRISTTSSAGFNRTVHYVGSTFDNYGLQGYIQDVRITRGVARYTANFTPPARAFQRK